MAAADGGENVTVVFSGMKPQLVIAEKKADEAVLFYKMAFGAEEVKRSTHPKRKAEQESPLILSAELKIGDSAFIVCDQTDDSAPALGKEEATASGISFLLATENVHDAVAKAVKAGATHVGDTTEGEGSLVATLKDPFGVTWIISAAKMTGGAEAL